MENLDKRLTVPKWVLMNQPKIPQMPQNLSAQIVCPSVKVWDFDEKRLHWASIVRVLSGQPPLHRRLHHHFFLQKCCCLLEHFKEHERGFILFKFN